MALIFEKVRLKPSQLRTVAERRFGDAKCLLESGKNERANGAIYLAGFVIECLLKARLLEKYPWLQSCGSPQSLTAADRNIWSLCYRSHKLEEILDNLPDVYRRMSSAQHGERGRLVASLKSVCIRWTIFIRYSPISSNLQQAGLFLSDVREIKQWLK
jgi:hypothetical protein